MNTSQLECFVQVAANLNFRQAAEELHLSQSTVSKQISALEREIGGALFVRSTRSVELTALGESFLGDAEEMLRLMYASSEKARKLVEGSNLAIGYSDPTELRALVPVLRALRNDSGNPSVTLRQGPRDVNVGQLSHGRLDLVLGFESGALEAGGIAFTLLREDMLVCIVRRDSPLAALDAVGAAQVKDLSQVVCLPAGLRRRGYAAQGAIPVGDNGQATFCQTASEAMCLVDAEFGFTLLPSVQACDSPTHVCLPWNGAPHARYGAYHREGDANPLVTAFLATATRNYGRDMA